METENTSSIFIVIPAFNEELIIQNVILSVKSCEYQNIVVVDDGSADDTFFKAKTIENITVLRHKNQPRQRRGHQNRN